MTAGAAIPFRVSIDGRSVDGANGSDVDADGRGVHTDQNTYQLIRQSGEIDDHIFEIEFLEAGRGGVLLHVRLIGAIVAPRYAPPCSAEPPRAEERGAVNAARLTDWATSSPRAEACLNEWPEHPPPMTMRGCAVGLTTNRPSGVWVMMQVVTPDGSGSTSGNYAATRSLISSVARVDVAVDTVGVAADEGSVELGPTFTSKPSKPTPSSPASPGVPARRPASRRGPRSRCRGRARCG